MRLQTMKGLTEDEELARIVPYQAGVAWVAEPKTRLARQGETTQRKKGPSVRQDWPLESGELKAGAFPSRRARVPIRSTVAGPPEAFEFPRDSDGKNWGSFANADAPGPPWT